MLRGVKEGSIFPSAFSDFLSGLWKRRLGSLWASPELTTINGILSLGYGDRLGSLWASPKLTTINGIIHSIEVVDTAIDVKN